MSIKIISQKRFGVELSPYIYGDFIEFLGDLIPGMWAEKIKDRSFEGDTHYSMEYYRAELERPQNHWHEFHYHAASRFSRDIVNITLWPPFCGNKAGRIDVSQISPEGNAGIYQDGINVEQGKKYLIELYLRSQEITEIEIIIGKWWGVFFETYARKSVKGINRDWNKFSFPLVSAATDPDASFIINVLSPGKLWIDKVSMMSADNQDGWRKDVVEAVKAMKPGMLRLGGSSFLYYGWEIGIGPREKRDPFENKPWGGMESNDVGLDEFLRFCELTESEPLICINAYKTTPENIANQVRYCNDSPTTQWGGRRAANGHRASYKVKYWQVGNEMSGSAYEDTLNDYCKAMKQADPSIILLASYPSERLIRQSAAWIDFVCPHYYESSVEQCRIKLQEVRNLIVKTAGKRKLSIGITEWNRSGSDFGLDRVKFLSMRNGLHCAGMFNLIQQNGDLIRIANRSNLCNSFFSGAIQATDDHLYKTPTYNVQSLYANKSEKYVLNHVADNQHLDVSVTANKNNSRAAVFVVNSTDQAYKEDIIFEGKAPSKYSLKIHTIKARSLDDINSFACPERIHVESSSKSGRDNSYSHIFAPYSVVCLEFHKQGTA